VNQELVDYISASSDTVPHEPWIIDDILRHVARGGQKILVAGGMRWRDRMRVDVYRRISGDSVLHATIRSYSPVRIILHDETEVDFFIGDSPVAFGGFHWNVAFLEEFQVDVISEPMAMPVYRIPSQAEWQDVNDAVVDALEFLRTHEGEAEFDFRGIRYKVPCGCDYAVEIGRTMPGFQFGFSGWRELASPTVSDSYAGISRSPVSTIGVASNASAGALLNAADMTAITNQFISSRMVDELYSESPLWERSRQNPRGDGPPLMWSHPPNDPLEFPEPPPYRHNQRPVSAVHLSEILTWPTPSARELDLQRRLDTVRECFAAMPNPLELRDPASAQRLMEALNYSSSPVQDLDNGIGSYLWAGMLQRPDGEQARVVLTGTDKLKHGTILDAAARSMRKFRIVEE
jgi:hypothetical protein